MARPWSPQSPKSHGSARRTCTCSTRAATSGCTRSSGSHPATNGACPATTSPSGRRTRTTSASSATSTAGTGAEPARPQSAPAASGAGSSPGSRPGCCYKYHIAAPGRVHRARRPTRSRSHARSRPRRAAVTWDLAYTLERRRLDGRHAAKRSDHDAPVSIYEVHLGSWMREADPPYHSLSYRDLAPKLADVLPGHGLHPRRVPADHRAPVLRVLGLPDDRLLRRDQPLRHPAGPDVPGRHAAPGAASASSSTGCRPTSPPTTGRWLDFDGTACYEHADPRQGFHPDWGSYVFNYGRHEVRSFLLSSAPVLARQVPHRRPARRCGGVDAVPRLLAQGRRVDSEPVRRQGEHRRDRLPPPVQRGGLPALPGRADVSPRNRTAWAMVSRPTYVGGLGFGYKWDMGWMHDTLEYFADRPDPPQVPPERPHVPDALRLQRELRPAALARRGGSREGAALGQDAPATSGRSTPVCGCSSLTSGA